MFIDISSHKISHLISRAKNGTKENIYVMEQRGHIIDNRRYKPRGVWTTIRAPIRTLALSPSFKQKITVSLTIAKEVLTLLPKKSINWLEASLITQAIAAPDFEKDASQLILKDPSAIGDHAEGIAGSTHLNPHFFCVKRKKKHCILIKTLQIFFYWGHIVGIKNIHNCL